MIFGKNKAIAFAGNARTLFVVGRRHPLRLAVVRRFRPKKQKTVHSDVTKLLWQVDAIDRYLEAATCMSQNATDEAKDGRRLQQLLV